MSEQPTTETKLAPCPFCGAVETLSEPDSKVWAGMEWRILSWRVRHWCSDKTHGSMLSVRGKNQQEAEERWNRRAAPEPAREMVPACCYAGPCDYKSPPVLDNPAIGPFSLEPAAQYRFPRNPDPKSGWTIDPEFIHNLDNSIKARPDPWDVGMEGVEEVLLALERLSEAKVTERSARRDVETGREMAGSGNGQPPTKNSVQTDEKGRPMTYWGGNPENGATKEPKHG